MSKERLRAEIDAIKCGLHGIVQKLDEIDKAYRGLPTEGKTDYRKSKHYQDELELSEAQLENLHFKPYKEGSKAGWIFADTEGAEKLYALIKESADNKVPLHNFEYSISKGDTKEFIGRKPIK